MKLFDHFSAWIESGMRGCFLLVCLAAYVANMAAPGLNLLAKSACLIAVVLIVVTGVSGSERLHTQQVWTRMALGLLVAHCVATIVWVVLWATPQIGDFGVYWRCGTMMPWSPSDWMQACKTTYLDAVGIYGKRSFVYTLPIGVLFGSNPVALEVLNAFLHILTAVMVYQVLCSRLGVKPAFLGLLILSLQPEWWYTLTIATPDNLAVPLVFICLILIERLVRSFSGLSVAGLSICIVMLEWSRSLAPFMLIAFFMTCIIYPDYRLRNVGQFILVVVAVFALNRGLELINAFTPAFSDPLKAFWALDLTIRPAQNFQTWFDWSDHLWPAIDPAQRSRVGFERFADELIVQFRYWPAYMVDKAAALFKGTGTQYFVGVDWPDNVETIYTTAKNTVPVGKWSVRLALAMPLIVLPVCAVTLMRSPLSLLGWVALAFGSVFLVLMVGFAEMLGRYGVLMVPVQVILVAHLAISIVPDQGPTKWTPTKKAFTGLVLFGLLFAAGLLASRFLQSNHPRLLMAMTQEGPLLVDGEACNDRQVPVWPYYGRRMRSLMPDDTRCISYHIPLEQAKDSLRAASLFVTREKFPFSHEKLDPVGFEYGFKLGDQPIEWFSLADKTAQWHQFDLEPFGSTLPSLQFIVHRRSGRGDIQFEIRDLLLRYP